MVTSYFLLSGSALCIAVMAILRKVYQEHMGTKLEEMLWFSALSSFVAFLLGLIISEGFEFEPVVFLLAVAYAICCTGTSILLIVGTKFGSVSKTIMSATMGTLVLPAIFGLLFDPADCLTWEKVVGFLFAVVTFLVGLHGNRESQRATDKRVQWINAAVFCSNGMALVVFKAKALIRPQFSQSAFVSEYMLIAASMSLVLFVILMLRKGKSGNMAGRKLFEKKALIPILAYAILFFASDSLAIHCTSVIPLTVQAPLSFCLTIMGTAVLELVFYKQKFSRKDCLQMAFALLCSICFVL